MVPLAFEANHGQTDSQYRYLARGAGYSILLADSGTAVLLPAGVQVRPAGAARAVRPEPQSSLAAKVNYLVGSDPTRWRTSLPLYHRVRYPQIYPGIDLVYYGSQNRLEYDFVVAPHADAARIRLEFQGARRLRLAGGDLVIETAHGRLRQHAPKIYQLRDDGSRVAITGRYRLAGGRTAAIALGAYDRSRALIIDPVLSYASFFGGTGNEAAVAMAVDPSGALYIAGQTNSGDLRGTAGVVQPGFGGQAADGFIAKVNSAGNALEFLTFFGGSGDDVIRAIALDAAGNIYVAGNTTSFDFFPGIAGFQKEYAGIAGERAAKLGDAFVAKLDPAASALYYATYLGGTGEDAAVGIAVDGAGSAYVTGFTDSEDFPVTDMAFQAVNSGRTRDVFVTKLSPAGTALHYSTYLGGTGDDIAGAIAVDAFGSAYVAGSTRSVDFPVRETAYQKQFRGPQGSSNGFLAKLQPNGSLEGATFLSGDGGQTDINALALEGDTVYVAGRTTSLTFPVTSGAVQPHYLAPPDAFVARLSGSGEELLYSTYLGGASEDSAFGLALDPARNIYVAGMTRSSDFPVSADALQKNPGGGADAFVTKIDAAGRAFVYSSYYGGKQDDAAFAVGLDRLAKVYIAGNTSSADLTVSKGAFQESYAGGNAALSEPRGDAFVSRIDQLTPLMRIRIVSGNNQTGVVGQPLPQPVVVQVIDGNGVPAPGITVQFTVRNGTPGATYVLTDEQGRASVTVTAGAVGLVMVTATVVGLEPVTASGTAIGITPTPVGGGPRITSIVNGFSRERGAAPGGLILIGMDGLEVEGAIADRMPLPNSLGGISSVTINGIRIPLLSVFSRQILAQVPFEIAPDVGTLEVRPSEGQAFGASLQVSRTSPGVAFGQDNRAVAQNADRSANSPENPALVESVVTVFLTGQGLVDPPVPSGSAPTPDVPSRPVLPVTATLGGENANVVSVTLVPDKVGVLQVAIQVPHVSTGDQILVVSVGGEPSNEAVISVIAGI